MVRYHSLAVDEATLPPCLEATAWATGVLSAADLRKRTAPPGNGAGSFAAGGPVSGCTERESITVEAAPTAHRRQQNGHSSAIAGVSGCGHTSAYGGSSSAAAEDQQRQASDAVQGGVAALTVEEGRLVGSDNDSPVVMGLAHRERPHMAVQFHPESIDTAYGVAVLQNFRDCTLRHLRRPVPPPLVASLRGALLPLRCASCCASSLDV